MNTQQAHSLHHAKNQPLQFNQPSNVQEGRKSKLKDKVIYESQKEKEKYLVVPM